MEWHFLVALAILFVLGLSTLGLRTWVKAFVEKEVQAKFDHKLERVRADLRMAEEQLKSSLKLQEADKASLRSTVLGGISQRQSLVDKRRVEAAESVWAAVIAMLPLKGVYQTLSHFPFKKVFEQSASDPKLQAFFKELFGSSLADPGIKSLRPEQLFLTPLAWAYFSAYRSMIYAGFARASVLLIGLKDAAEMLDYEPLKSVLIAALPMRKNFIEAHDADFYYMLFDELENKLLEELKSILDGREIDEGRAGQVSQMLAAVASLEAQTAKNSDKLDLPGFIDDAGCP